MSFIRMPCALLGLLLLAAAAVDAAIPVLDVDVCAWQELAVDLDSIPWGPLGRLHRLKIATVATGTHAAKVRWNAGDRHLVISPRGPGWFNITVHAADADLGTPASAGVAVTVLPETSEEGVCTVVRSSIFCDSVNRNNQRDAAEAGVPHINVAVVSTAPGQQRRTRYLETDSRGGWAFIQYMPTGTFWNHKATYTFRDQTTAGENFYATAGAGTAMQGPTTPVASLLNCDITAFTSFPMVDCRCKTISVHGAMVADAEHAPIVVDRPMEIEGVDGSVIDGTGLPAGVPIFVAEGAGSRLALHTTTLRTARTPALALMGGQNHQVLTTTFAFEWAPAVVIARSVPGLDISWNSFSAGETTRDSPVALYAISVPDNAWGAGSVVLYNAVHTPSCHSEKLLLTGVRMATGAPAEVLYTSDYCGPDHRINDPCIYGRMSRMTGMCECEYGCSDYLCDGRRAADKGEVFVCYYSLDLAKRVALLLPVADALGLLEADAGRKKEERHELRDACEETKGISREACEEYGPTRAYECNCGPLRNYNHTVTDPDRDQVMSEYVARTGQQRDARMKEADQRVADSTSAFYSSIVPIPLIITLVLGYVSWQNERFFMEVLSKMQTGPGMLRRE